MRLLIAGGGTGGHLFPGIALAQELMQRSPESAVLFVGTERGLESRLVPRAGFPLRFIAARALKGRNIFGAARTLLGLPGAFAQSMGILGDWRPDIVLGVGGYASGPLLVAAAVRRIARAVIEPNALPGVTNRILGRMVQEVYVAWDETVARFPPGKAVVTGNPIRQHVGAVTEGEKASAFSVLVFGGSQGAHRINEAMMGALDFMKEPARRFRFAHQTGEADREMVTSAYAARGIAADVSPFFDDMPARYQAADLVVSRAGATTVTELTCAGKGSLLIPYPFAADDHQVANAQVLERAGAALVVLEKHLTPLRLAELVNGLEAKPEQAREMGQRARALAKPDAAKVILERLEKLVAGN